MQMPRAQPHRNPPARGTSPFMQVRLALQVPLALALAQNFAQIEADVPRPFVVLKEENFAQIEADVRWQKS